MEFLLVVVMAFQSRESAIIHRFSNETDCRVVQAWFEQNTYDTRSACIPVEWNEE